MALIWHTKLVLCVLTYFDEKKNYTLRQKFTVICILCDSIFKCRPYTIYRNFNFVFVLLLKWWQKKTGGYFRKAAEIFSTALMAQTAAPKKDICKTIWVFMVLGIYDFDSRHRHSAVVNHKLTKDSLGHPTLPVAYQNLCP